MNSILTIKLFWTLAVIGADLILFMIPFLFSESSKWEKGLNYMNAMFGGVLLAICFVSLLSDATIEVLTFWGDYPIVFIVFTGGMIFSCIAPRMLKLIRKKIGQNENVQNLETKFQMKGMIVQPELLERDEKSQLIHVKKWKENPNFKNGIEVVDEPISKEQYEFLKSYEQKHSMIEDDSEDELLEKSNLLVFVLISLFESLLSMMIIGFQTIIQHISLLSILTILGDSIQMIIIGIAVKSYIDLNPNINNYQRYMPCILIVIFIIILNALGSLIGSLCILFIDINKNKIIFIVISECFMAFNSGIFTKVSIVDMINVELNKKRDSDKTIVKKFFAILIGSGIGTGIALLIREIQS